MYVNYAPIKSVAMHPNEGFDMTNMTTDLILSTDNEMERYMEGTFNNGQVCPGGMQQQKPAPLIFTSPGSPSTSVSGRYSSETSPDFFPRGWFICSLISMWIFPWTICCSSVACAYSMCSYTDWRVNDAQRFNRRNRRAKSLLIVAVILGFVIMVGLLFILIAMDWQRLARKISRPTV